MKIILIVDDQKLWRDRLREFMEGAGHSVLEAECGNSALEAVRQSRPDLILLDYQMPEMNGVETARQIRACNGYEGVPIILVSGEELPGSCSDTALPYVNGFLDKKNLRDSLPHCIEHHL